MLSATVIGVLSIAVLTVICGVRTEKLSHVSNGGGGGGNRQQVAALSLTSDRVDAKFAASVPSEFLTDVTIVQPANEHEPQRYDVSSSSGVAAAAAAAAFAAINDDNSGGCPAVCACLGDYFECKKQGLRAVPVLPHWVRNLELTGNKLDDRIEDALTSLPYLTSLNLRKNLLTQVPHFRGLVKLEKLNVAHNTIETISPKALQALPELRELDLARNRIKAVTLDLFPTPNKISLLNLNGNQVEMIAPHALDALGELTELHMSHNRVRSLPDEIFNSLKSLRKLDLSHNRLNTTWTTFKGLEQLRVLNLAFNEITRLPDGVFEPLRSIAVLELNGNRLTNLSRSGFFNLYTLATLSLANNTIARIEPDTWEFVQQLVTLDLSHNNLTRIDRGHFKCLSKLKKLHLQQNHIRHIDDGTFTCLTSVEYLDLSDNELSTTMDGGTPAPFGPLKKLHTLELRNNELRSINKKAFTGLEGLVSLNLDRNNITSIQFNAFEPLKRLNRLVINSTHLLCDCTLQWLHEWLSLRGQQDDVVLQQQHIAGEKNDLVLVCDYPPEVHGKALIALRRDDDFMCSESPKPRILKEPQTQLAIKGTNVTLECTAISAKPGPLSIHWRRDNIDLKDNETDSTAPRLAVEITNNSTLATSTWQLTNVKRDDTGKYQCVATNNFGSTHSQRFKITVATYPSFRMRPTNVTLKVGTTARLDCAALGDPMPQISWQKDGGHDFPAARERRMQVMPSDDAFFIINVKSVDMGIYTCTAANPAGVIRANATLTVHEIPAIVQTSEFHHEIVTGKSFVIECFVYGSPFPEITWYKNNESLSTTNLPERYYFAAQGQLLVITQADYTDAGLYKCHIKNELGMAERETIVIASTTTGTGRNPNNPNSGGGGDGGTGGGNNKLLRAAAAVSSDELTVIIVITIFCCTLTTSFVWLLIICHSKKTSECNNNVNTTNAMSNGGLDAHLRTQPWNFRRNHDLNTTETSSSVASEQMGVAHQILIEPPHQRTEHNNSKTADSLKQRLRQHSSNSAATTDDTDLSGYNQQQQQMMPLIQSPSSTTIQLRTTQSQQQRSPPPPPPSAMSAVATTTFQVPRSSSKVSKEIDEPSPVAIVNNVPRCNNSPSIESSA